MCPQLVFPYAAYNMEGQPGADGNVVNTKWEDKFDGQGAGWIGSRRF